MITFTEILSPLAMNRRYDGTWFPLRTRAKLVAEGFATRRRYANPVNSEMTLDQIEKLGGKALIWIDPKLWDYSRNAAGELVRGPRFIAYFRTAAAARRFKALQA